MNEENLIEVEQICSGYGIEFTFIDSLNEHGLINVISRKDHRFIDRENLSALEKMMRMHYELGMNLEGIEVALNLLQRMDELENEIKVLKARIEV